MMRRMHQADGCPVLQVVVELLVHALTGRSAFVAAGFGWVMMRVSSPELKLTLTCRTENAAGLLSVLTP